MTLTADTKKRVVIPGAAPGDVFSCERRGQDLVLRRIYRPAETEKPTRQQALRTIRSWNFKPAMSWERLRELTREP